MGARALNAILLDTHAWIWALMDAGRLGAAAKAAIESREVVYVSPISVYEVIWKVRIGKWASLKPHIDALMAEPQAASAPFTRDVAARAAMLDWAHRDPFDRFIAATAIEVGCELASKDPEFDGLSDKKGWIRRVWA